MSRTTRPVRKPFAETGATRAAAARRALLPLAALLAAASLASCGPGADTHAAELSGRIIGVKKNILSVLPGNEGTRARFLAFWDFDGTILNGDCTEGLTAGGSLVFKGLAQKAIEDGLSAEFPPGSYGRFRDLVTRLEREDHDAYLLNYPRAIAGNREDAVTAYAGRYGRAVLSRYYFRSSMEILRSLTAAGIESYIISASAGPYVKGAAAATGIPPERILGIAMKSDRGRITREPVPPVTYGPGKTETLKRIVADLEARDGCRVFVLAGFGNSYDTDGDFLAHVARAALPGGEPVAVMINGGPAPARYRGLFREVRQEAVTGN